MRRNPVKLLVATLMMAATGGALHAQSDDGPGQAGMPERGAALYRQYYCGACHRLDALGTKGFFGPSHDDAGSVAHERVADPAYGGAARDAEGYLREAILDPGAYVAPGYAGTPHAMPGYDLPEEELDALVRFLLSQQGSPSDPSSSGGG